jgi:Mg-chelatase subunit ChlD
MFKKRSGNSLFPFILIAVVGYLIIFSEEENPSPPKNSSHLPSQRESAIERLKVSNSPPSLFYANTPLSDNWPNEQQTSDNDIFTASKELTAKNYYLVLDASGSMMDSTCSSGQASKMQSAISALRYFASQLPDDANFGLAVFLYGELKELLPLGKNNRQEVEKLLVSIVPNGGTPLDQAIDFGYQKLLSQGKRQQGYGEYNLVIVTDGLASGGHHPEHAVERILKESPVILHTIGFCIAQDHSLNRPGLTLYRSANDPESLKQGLVNVLAESPEFDLSSFSE